MVGFLGDKQTTLVHHLANMKKECKIVEMKIQDRQYFTPDTLNNVTSSIFLMHVVYWQLVYSIIFLKNNLFSYLLIPSFNFFIYIKLD